MEVIENQHIKKCLKLTSGAKMSLKRNGGYVGRILPYYWLSGAIYVVTVCKNGIV